jgi:hypothetical protein
VPTVSHVAFRILYIVCYFLRGNFVTPLLDLHLKIPGIQYLFRVPALKDFRRCRGLAD